LAEGTLAAKRVAIKCTGISKRYGQLQALRDASMSAYAGEITALLGDNGAGKSTLVKCIAGAVSPEAGTIELLGERVTVSSTRHAQELGIQTIYQDLALAPDLSVLDNVFLGREILAPGWRGKLGVLSRAEMQTEAEQAVAQVGVRIKSVRSPVRDLSGGQRQAVAVTKAMRQATTAVLMDEPTAALGARQRAIVYDAARSAAEKGLAVLMISHDIPQMLELADRITIMRQGLVVAEDDVSVFDQRSVMDLMLGGN
jgi:simple sugar transport system ATP-binding protein